MHAPQYPFPTGLTQTTRLERTETVNDRGGCGGGCSLTQTTRLERTETFLFREGGDLVPRVSPKRLDLRELKPQGTLVMIGVTAGLTQTTRLERTETR